MFNVFCNVIKVVAWVSWGFHSLDWLPKWWRNEIDAFGGFEEIARTALSIVGVIYLVWTMYHKIRKSRQDYQAGKLEKQIKKNEIKIQEQELIKLRHENKGHIPKNKAAF